MCSCLFLSCSLVTPSAHTHTHNWSAAAENIVFVKDTIYLHLNLWHMYNKLRSEYVNCRTTLRSHHRCYFSLKPSFHQKLPPSSTRVNQVSSKHQCFTQTSSTLDFSVQALGYYNKHSEMWKCETACVELHWVCCLSLFLSCDLVHVTAATIWCQKVSLLCFLVEVGNVHLF